MAVVCDGSGGTLHPALLISSAMVASTSADRSCSYQRQFQNKADREDQPTHDEHRADARSKSLLASETGQ